MNGRMVRTVSVGFDGQLIKVSLNNLRPNKAIAESFWKTKKYRQILESIKAIGLVEPVVVRQHPAEAGAYLIIDGHLRVEALRACGVAATNCLLALDDESFTYNRHTIGIASVQIHKMIVKALDRGVPAEDLAAALGMSVDMIKARFRMLDGICPEAAAILADKDCPAGMFHILRKMKPLRQIDAANRMVDFNNYSIKFAMAMLEATPDELLAAPLAKNTKSTSWSEANARLEREVAALQVESRMYEDNYGRDNLQLMMITTYLQSLLTDARIVLWLSENRRDYLTEFKKIADIKSLPTSAS
ncbi:plasmid partitioning protein RepB C-terminal domain-containing protein [Burkholderia contaminans]|uniref:plasmid partitioning protein RepB C-terminal domain-containing protein n=1 Tax=Burkholderia contaminans TaxID=488447 RepID=UPI00158E3AFF|nr:plasmid partitioning protein RepB C-terminal domain-containing protein [Burkholderia contaminans]